MMNSSHRLCDIIIQKQRKLIEDAQLVVPQELQNLYMEYEKWQQGTSPKKLPILVKKPSPGAGRGATDPPKDTLPSIPKKKQMGQQNMALGRLPGLESGSRTSITSTAGFLPRGEPKETTARKKAVLRMVEQWQLKNSIRERRPTGSRGDILHQKKLPTIISKGEESPRGMGTFPPLQVIGQQFPALKSILKHPRPQDNGSRKSATPHHVRWLSDGPNGE